MGNYALREHIEGRLGSDVVGQLTLPAMPLTLDDYFDLIIGNAEGVVDAYIRNVYTVPIVTDASNGFIRELVLDLAEYEIFKKIVADNVPTKYFVSMERAMQTLKDISAGLLSPFATGKAKNNSLDITTDTMVMDETSLTSYA